VEGERVQRRLAAILAADVAGYSRLTGADEEGTIARLRALRRELIDPTIEARRGRIVKTTGDGILIEFPSVVGAVRCAVEMQRGMVLRNTTVPLDKRIDFRVGVHLGDVVGGQAAAPQSGGEGRCFPVVTCAATSVLAVARATGLRRDKMVLSTQTAGRDFSPKRALRFAEKASLLRR
jgi:hypothetical protein